MSEPLAFLLTFRTYGTWLHGDERGSVDRRHNAPGSPLLPANDSRLQYEQRNMVANPTVFDEQMRSVVDAAIHDQCQYRGWELRELAVRSNHVHVVVDYAGVEPERIIR